MSGSSNKHESDLFDASDHFCAFENELQCAGQRDRLKRDAHDAAQRHQVHHAAAEIFATGQRKRGGRRRTTDIR